MCSSRLDLLEEKAIPSLGDVFHVIKGMIFCAGARVLHFGTNNLIIMKKLLIYVAVGIACTALLNACTKEKDENIDSKVFSASGNITPKVDEFRQFLGTLNNTPGAVGGRREVNWDTVPDSLMSQKLPDDFFNPVGAGAQPSRQKGLAYSPDSGEFRVSNAGFNDIDPEAAPEFASFSGNKTFANVSAVKWPVGFQVAGAATPATVKGFGAVFIDVDLDNSTSVEFFENDKSLGVFFVPKHDATTKFSFLGVYFTNHKITHLKISHQGRLIEGLKDISTGGANDLILLDDFIYSEPVALGQ